MKDHLHIDTTDDALDAVLRLAEQIDADGLTASERVNTALTLHLERSGQAMSLATQRDVYGLAVAILEARPEAHASMAVAKPAAPPEAPRKPQETAPAHTETKSATDTMELASRVVRDLSGELDFTEIATLSEAEQQVRIHQAITGLSVAQKMHLNSRELGDLVRTVLADMLGLGPLEPLLADERITDIMVNGPRQVYVERGGKLELTPVRFRDDAHVMAVASRIVAEVGRREDESQPMVDARLKDGSRVNVAVPPLAIDGPTITIRKFPSDPVRLEALVAGGSLSGQMAQFLKLAAYLRLNVLVSGGTGSGKTTLLNALSQHIPAGERVVTLEDAAELRFQQPHVVRFETRPPNLEGSGEVTMRTLVRNALRMRPDRIIIGEIRGDEVLDLLQAMNTGHDGSMSTLHANSPREALTRVEGMAALAGFNPGGGVVRRQLTDAVHLIVQVARMRDGKRRVTSISEIAGIAGDSITLQELFTFEADPTSTRTEVRGAFRASGYRPKFAERAADYGVSAELDSILKG